MRRIEADEVIEVTVSGRLAARMIPAQPKQWLDWSEVAECFIGLADPGWDTTVISSTKNSSTRGTTAPDTATNEVCTRHQRDDRRPHPSARG